MLQINPHINFNGNAEEAFTFYQSVFGGTFVRLVRFKDLSIPGFAFKEEEQDKVMHIALPIGENLLMGNDIPQFMGRVNELEHRSKISITVAEKEEAERIFNNLSAGGIVEMSMTDSPWGTYFGMFRDKYGIEWMIEQR